MQIYNSIEREGQAAGILVKVVLHRPDYFYGEPIPQN